MPAYLLTFPRFIAVSGEPSCLRRLLNAITMSGAGGAYGTKASDTDFRKKWDKEEYAEKAKKKDQEERERMQENEERMKQGVCTPTTLCIWPRFNLR